MVIYNLVSSLIPAVCYCSRRHIYSMYPVHPLTRPQMLSPSSRMGATHPDDPRCGHLLQAKLGASPPPLPNLVAPQTIVVTPANVITAASKLPFPRTQTPTAYTPLACSQRLSMGLCHRLSFAGVLQSHQLKVPFPRTRTPQTGAPSARVSWGGSHWPSSSLIAHLWGPVKVLLVGEVLLIAL